MRWQLSITNWTSATLSSLLRYFRKTMPSKFAFQLLFNPFNQDAKTGKGCYSRGIRAHSDSRKRAWVFQRKLRKKELKVCGWKCQMLSCIWKKLQLFTALPACCKIARTNVNVEKTRLLAIVQLRAQEQVFNWLLVGWAMIEIIEVQFVEMTGAATTK